MTGSAPRFAHVTPSADLLGVTKPSKSAGATSTIACA